MKNFPVLRARMPKKKDDATVQNKLTAAERAERYREKRKNDTSFKEKEKLRKRVAWQQRTLGQKEKDTLRNRKNHQREQNHLKKVRCKISMSKTVNLRPCKS
ncbi:hypothetical protein KP79_PYT00789 [Mizuhopecten yessoensis]|uniref:Uncharacterized protein n=1 Tax=Mizuhopecten yessoensis TaxID=6573 RepID=A0A210QQI8_MIZYE|nr:hypothetical protein KP79_PYT00789 [Mizuhopecten yessoensis]